MEAPDDRAQPAASAGADVDHVAMGTVTEDDVEPGKSQGLRSTIAIPQQKTCTRPTTMSGMDQRLIREISNGIGEEFSRLRINLCYTKPQFARLKDAYPNMDDQIFNMLNEWHDVVVRCGENPHHLLAAALDDSELRYLAVPKLVTSKELDGLTVTEREPRAETKKQIELINFSVPGDTVGSVQVYNVQNTINVFTGGSVTSHGEPSLNASEYLAILPKPTEPGSKRPLRDPTSTAQPPAKKKAGNQEKDEDFTHVEDSKVQMIARDEVHNVIADVFKGIGATNAPEADYQRKCEEFRRRLVQHYTKNVASISLSPLMPNYAKSLMEIYASPKICRIQSEKDGTRKKTEQLYTYKDIFHSVQTTGKHIFLQGEPGKGKSTFAAKLVVDWCNICNTATQSTEKKSAFSDVESLRKFRFVFHIALRESRKERRVVQMIQKQIIEMLYDDEDDVKNAYKLLLTIITKEACLVVEDGLDEWSDPDGKLPLPILADPCVVFITTRPWKMSDEQLKTSIVDCLLEIEGVIEPFVLSKSVLECLISENLDAKCEAFKMYIYRNELTKLLETPLLLTLIVCLWVDNSFLTGSACEIYSLLLDSLLKKANSKIAYFQPSPFTCFKDTKYLKLNMHYIKSLSKAAFHFLFSDGNEHALVFNDRELSKYLTDLEKVFALKSGILTERKLSTLSYRPSTCSFIHKSFQEFLAALHIASNVELVDSDLLQKFSTGQIELSEISQVFKFLCGLSITAANRLSRAFRTFTDPEREYRFSVEYCRRNLQDLIITGYAEAKANKVPDEEIRLQLNNVYFHFTPNTETLKCLVLKNISNIQSVEFKQSVEFESNSFSELVQHILTSCSTCSTLSSNTLSVRRVQQEITLGCKCERVHPSPFHSLAHIAIDTRVTLLPTALCGLPNLKSINLNCKCDGLVLSACNSLRDIELGEHVTFLPNALCGLPEMKRISLNCKHDGLDLSACNSLENIELGEHVTLLPNALCGLPNLKSINLNCKYDGLDLSAWNSLENIELGEHVTLLPNGLCGLPNLKSINLNCKCDGLVLSACNSLRDIELGEHVTLLPNALCGLLNLEWITLNCKYDGLDLSAWNSLEKIKLGC